MAHVLNRSPSSISRVLRHKSMPVAMPALMPTSTGGKMPDRSADAMQIRVWFVRCSSPFLAGTLVARANCLDTGTHLPESSQEPRVTQDDQQLHLRPARWRAAPGIGCLPAPSPPQTNTRSKGQDRCGQIPDMLSMRVRLPEIENRQFQMHGEGDLIKGEANAIAVGTLVERTSQLLIPIKPPQPRPQARSMRCKPSRTSCTVLRRPCG